MKTIAIIEIESVEKFVARLFVLVGSACRAGIVLTIGYSVVMRYIFNQPTGSSRRASTATGGASPAGRWRGVSAWSMAIWPNC
jgi:hypothetical protein